MRTGACTAAWDITKLTKRRPSPTPLRREHEARRNESVGDMKAARTLAGNHLRVKLGTTRPPMSSFIRMVPALPLRIPNSAAPLICASTGRP
jgi:hypothetical protein